MTSPDTVGIVPMKRYPKGFVMADIVGKRSKPRPESRPEG